MVYKKLECSPTNLSIIGAKKWSLYIIIARHCNLAGIYAGRVLAGIVSGDIAKQENRLNPSSNILTLK